MRERLPIFVIVGMRTDEHSLRSQVSIRSESECLLGQLERILEISDSVAGLKVEKSGGVAGLVEENTAQINSVGLPLHNGQSSTKHSHIHYITIEAGHSIKCITGHSIVFNTVLQV